MFYTQEMIDEIMAKDGIFGEGAVFGRYCKKLIWQYI